MNIIAESHGIKLRAPDDAYFSYFNSPYTGHSLGCAIDIYPKHDNWRCDIVSPVTGQVVRIRKLRMGNSKEFPTEDYDFGLALRPEESDCDIIRILHIEPAVKIGDKISTGDRIGTTIRSRYFNYWTGPHYHVEIMNQNSFNRSSQSYALEFPLKYTNTAIESSFTTSDFKIQSVTEDCLTGYPKSFNHTSIGKFHGLSATDENGIVVGILDGGLSHYKHGGVIGSDNIQLETTINLEGISIGKLSTQMRGVSHFNQGPLLNSSIDKFELRGLSCFIYPKNYLDRGIPQLILVPKKYDQFRNLFAEGEVAELQIDGIRGIGG